MTQRFVLVLYNSDYDEELTSQEGVDESAVRLAAQAVCDALIAYGFRSELVAIHGVELTEIVDGVRGKAPDLVFNLCESLNGDVRNEMVVPSILDMLGIPYTGAGPLTLGMCLHKDRTKEVLVARGVPTPPYRLLRGPADVTAFDLPLPVFLKLAHEDASIGIEESNVARDRAGLRRRAEQLWAKYHQSVVAERYIEGREVNVTILGAGDDLQVLPLHEIDFAAMPADRPRIVSYAAKWDESHVDYAGTKPVPMKNVTPALQRAIEQVACDAYRAMELRDFGRVDLRVDGNGQPWVIDVNPNCDLSSDAGFARAARAGGLEYPQLIGRICEIAWSRYGDRASLARAG